MVFCHPVFHTFQDQLPHSGVFCFCVVTATAVGDVIPFGIQAEVHFPVNIFERVIIVVGNVIVNNIHDNCNIFPVESLDHVFEFRHSPSIYSVPYTGCIGSIGAVVGFGSEEKGGHVAPVVSGVWIPGVIDGC